MRRKKKKVSDDIEYIEINLEDEPDKSGWDDYFEDDAEDESYDGDEESSEDEESGGEEDAAGDWEGLSELEDEDISVGIEELEKKLFAGDGAGDENARDGKGFGGDGPDEDDSDEEDFDDEDFDDEDFDDEDFNEDDLGYGGSDEEDFDDEDLKDEDSDEDDLDDGDSDEEDSDNEDSEEDSEDETSDEDKDSDMGDSDEDDAVGGKKETETERKLRIRKRKKIAAVTAGSIFGVLAAAYIGVAVYFGSHFLFHTTINGMDCSTKDVAQVEEYMKGQVDDYVLTIAESDGTSEQISGEAISLEYVPGKELEKLVKKQKNFLWPASLWKPAEIEASVGVQYNEEALAAQIGALSCLVPENQTPSIDAHPEFKETEFVVVPEEIGTQIETEKFQETVTAAINGFQHTVNLLKEGCYVKPRFFEDSEEVINAKDAMNSYLGASITYDFSPNTEVVDSSVISQWITVDADMNVAFNQEAVRAYVAALAEKYDTIGKTREFTTANGNVVSVEPGTYGWEIDQETEYAALTASIQNAEVVTKTPAYFSTAATHDTMDMGNSYAEVDLSAQNMWLFQDGQVVFQAPVVTGNPNIGNRATPSGVYSILEMLSPTVLVGEKDPKTGQPEYKTPVTYWMRVTWSGIGFHDATWQPGFGGSLYLSIGSHGCINMSYNDAATLYSMIYVGLPVVIHY